MFTRNYLIYSKYRKKYYLIKNLSKINGNKVYFKYSSNDELKTKKIKRQVADIEAFKKTHGISYEYSKLLEVIEKNHQEIIKLFEKK